MGTLKKQTIPALFQQTVIKYGNNNALATVGKKPITYTQLNNEVKAVMALLEQLGIKKGHKLAILSINTPRWVSAYLAINHMGAVSVPLLPDFSDIEIENILNHSEAKVLFVSDNLKYKLKDIHPDFLQHQVNIEDFSTSQLGVDFDADATPQNSYAIDEGDLASIIYTSGTTGTSKGVMLTHKNIAFNAASSGKVQVIKPTDRFLSILPLSHAYENTIGLILPLMEGACVYYLSKPPTPAVLLPALKAVRPTIMLSVPLIIEKIFRNRVLAEINAKAITKMLYKIPLMRKKFHAVAGKKLYQTFGGELKFFGIGGAKLDPIVERFLREAKFPYAIGYGLTETAPLIAGANPQDIRYQSTGPAVDGVELIINNPDKHTGEGEIWAKGPNVMKGYYKAPELTNEVLTSEGWFKTGDLGVFDQDGHLSIKGRLKNMIVGPSGENIYPEEIESVINNYKFVLESLVVQKKGKLVALVHFNTEELEKRYLHLKDEVENYIETKVDELKMELQSYINARVNKFSRVQLIVPQPVPFHKTATHKIKRYMYN